MAVVCALAGVGLSHNAEGQPLNGAGDIIPGGGIPDRDAFEQKGLLTYYI